MVENKSWVNHIEWAVLMVTILGGFYGQGARTDRIYEMYVDTQKEICQLRIDWLNNRNDNK